VKDRLRPKFRQVVHTSVTSLLLVLEEEFVAHLPMLKRKDWLFTHGPEGQNSEDDSPSSSEDGMEFLF
jgi:hypothetical protein